MALDNCVGEPKPEIEKEELEDQEHLPGKDLSHYGLKKVLILNLFNLQLNKEVDPVLLIEVN